MKIKLDLLTVLTDDNGAEIAVYIDRDNGRVFAAHPNGSNKATSIDAYGQIFVYDEDDFENLKKGGDHGDVLHD